MKKFAERIKEGKVIVGMIHVRALPGTPKYDLKPEEIIQKAIEEAKIYQRNGIDVVAIENMHDLPYVKNPGPEISSIMAIIGREIKKLGIYCGIQILAGANKEALAVAKAAGLDFVRAEGFVYAHIADEGYIESCAGELLRHRKAINAEEVMIFVDIKKKHSSHSITSDVSIEETAHAADFFGADGLIITGISTGVKPSLEEVKKVRESTKNKIILGSGITDENLRDYVKYAEIFIIGSFFKKQGLWSNEMDEERIKRFMKEFNSLVK